MLLTRRTFLKGTAATVILSSSCRDAFEAKPNIVVVLVDQLRKQAADDWMPGVNALASAGVRFEAMRAAAPWTYPSVVSMFSGLYPQQHGADGEMEGPVLSIFDKAVPLMHRNLRAGGYTTAAFVTNPFLGLWNPFHIGFDSFNTDFIEDLGPARGGVHQRFETNRMYADNVDAAIQDHFGSRSRVGPEFTYVHYIDVHGPWIEGVPFAADYRSAVEYIDRRIVDLYRYFMRRYDDDLIFLLTADHGRSVKDDLEVGYGPFYRKNKLSVHDFNLKIPCMVFPSRHVIESRTILDSCSNIDINPTLLDWAGMGSEPALPARTLLPAIQGNGTFADRVVYSRVSAFGGHSDSITWRDRKYMRYFDLDTGETIVERVFDLVNDPRETVSRGEISENARQLLKTASGKHGTSFATRYEPVDRDLRERLRALGYLDADETASWSR